MKYRRDQPIETNLAENEPYFLIRGHDLLAIPTLVQYARLAQNVAPDVATGVQAVVVEFAEWQNQHPAEVKLPD